MIINPLKPIQYPLNLSDTGLPLLAEYYRNSHESQALLFYIIKDLCSFHDPGSGLSQYGSVFQFSYKNLLINIKLVRFAFIQTNKSLLLYGKGKLTLNNAPNTIYLLS